ncbi:macro domain-containing protein, partial [Faecalibacillus intestinalis]|uniref:macro domain-containing protein n=1 Tax=Faecalibacillus intestinalis TaxID=1982626 RepID=UPI001EE07FBA
HAVGPRYGDANDADLLMSAYRSALARADEVSAKSVAFPSISTGVYGYPGGLAAMLSVEAIITARTKVETILLVAFSDDMA